MTVIENTQKAQDKFGHGWGSEWNQLSENDIKALQDGKQLAFDDGEYAHFFSMNEPT